MHTRDLYRATSVLLPLVLASALVACDPTGATDAHNQAVSQGSELAVLAGQVADLQKRVAAADTERASLAQRLDAADADRSALADRVAALESVNAGQRLASLEAAKADERLTALESVNADQRLTTLEALNAGTRLAALEALDAGTRLTALEGLNAGSRLTALESAVTTLQQQSTPVTVVTESKPVSQAAGTTVSYASMCCPGGYTALALSVVLRNPSQYTIFPTVNETNAPVPGNGRCFQRFIYNNSGAGTATQMDSTLACARL